MGNNDDDLPLQDLAGPSGELPPGPHELQGIVRRAGRHYRRAAALGMAATLVVGGGAGYLIANRSTPAATTVAVGTSGTTTTVPAGLQSGAPSTEATGGGLSTTFNGALPLWTPLFTRVAGPVTIRAFLTNYPQPPAPTGLPANCGPFGPPQFQAELSTARMVGDASGFLSPDRTKPISGATTMVMGATEGDPTIAVVAAAAPGVATVRMTFTGGTTDRMTPVHGWVTLAAEVGTLPSSPTTAVGTLTALDASGRVLATQAVTMANGEPISSGCATPCPEPPSPTGPATAVPTTNAGGTSTSTFLTTPRATLTGPGSTGPTVSCSVGRAFATPLPGAVATTMPAPMFGTVPMPTPTTPAG